MANLIAFYSRTGITKKVAELLAKRSAWEIEEIRDTCDRSGAKGYLLAGQEAVRGDLTKLQPFGNNISSFDTLIIGTPIWAWTMAPAVRTFLVENQGKFKKVAFFCTMGGSGSQRAFRKMAELINLQPVSTLALGTKEVVATDYSTKLDRFIKEIT